MKCDVQLAQIQFKETQTLRIVKLLGHILIAVNASISITLGYARGNNGLLLDKAPSHDGQVQYEE